MAKQLIKIGEFPPLATIIGNETLPLGRASDGVGVGVSMDEFKDWIGFTQFQGVIPQPAPTNKVLTGVAGTELIYIGGAGSYTLNGSTRTLTEPINYFFWNGTEWKVLEAPVSFDKIQREVDIATNISKGEPFTLDSSYWELGSISTSGVNQPTSNKIRLKDYFEINKRSVLSLSDHVGFRFNISLFKKSDSTFIKETGYIDHDYIVQQDCYIKITVGHEDNRTISDISSVSSKVRIKLNVLKEKSIDVSILTDNLNKEIRGKDFKISSIDWELGALGLTTGLPTSAIVLDNIRTVDFKQLYKGDKIYLEEYADTRYNVLLYNISDKTYIGASPSTTPYVMPQDALVKIRMYYTDSRVINNIEALSSKLSISPDNIKDNSITEQKLSVGLISMLKGEPFAIQDSMWEFGSLAPSGGISGNAKDKIRLSNYYEAAKGLRLILTDYSEYRFNIFLFKISDKTLITSTGWITEDYTLPQDCFIKVAISHVDNRLMVNTIELSDKLILSNAAFEIEDKSITINKLSQSVEDALIGMPFTIPTESWQFGTILTSGGNATISNDKIRTIDYLKVPKGKVIGVKEGFRYAIHEYRLSDKGSITTTRTYRTDDYVIPQDCYIRIIAGYLDNRIIARISDVSDKILIKNTTTNIEDRYNPHALPVTAEYRYARIFNTMGGQGMCVVRNELWHFFHSDVGDDDHGQYGNIIRHDINTRVRLPDLSHNLGHCSSVDYSIINDAMLEGNGTWDYTVKPRIDIFLNASSRVGNDTPIDIFSNEVISIPLFTAEKEIGGQQTLACWGEDARIIYVVTGGTEKTKFFRMFLGTGEEDFSDKSTGSDDVTKWGTFIPGKGANEFNGTVKVIGEYIGLSTDQEIRQGIQFHDGQIWLLSGWNYQRISKIQCFDDGTFRVMDWINLRFYNPDGSSRLPEPQGMVIYNNYAYVGLKSPINRVVAIPINNKQNAIGTIGVRMGWDFKIAGVNPNLQITPLTDTTDLYIESMDNEGFTVQSKSGGMGTFNWEASC